MFGSCEEVTKSLAEDRGQGQAPSLTVRLHLLLCKYCRRYRQQLALIGNAARNEWKDWLRQDPAVGTLRERILRDKTPGS